MPKSQIINVLARDIATALMATLFAVTLTGCGAGALPGENANTPSHNTPRDPMIEIEIVTQSLPQASVAAAYSTAIEVAGGSGSYAWSLAGGALPQGLTLSANGTDQAEIAGTPLAKETAQFTLTVRDLAPMSGAAPVSKTFSINVIEPVVQYYTGPLTLNCDAGVPFSAMLRAAGQEPPDYRWGSDTRDPIWAWLHLTDDGVLSGTPPDTGTGGAVSYYVDVWLIHTFWTVEIFDQTIQIDIQEAALPLSIVTTTLPAGHEGVAYSAAVAVSGGVAPYRFALTGLLPPGLMLGIANGVLSGAPSPSSSGHYQFTVNITDAAGAVASGQVDVTISATLAILPASLPDCGSGGAGGSVGYGFDAYETRLDAAGGTPPYRFTISNQGTLPTGFTLSEDGLLCGKGAAGSFTFDVDVTSADGRSGSRTMTLNVIETPSLYAINGTLPEAREGEYYSFKPTVAGPRTGYFRWAVDWSSTRLPTGLNILDTVQNDVANYFWGPEVLGTPAIGSSTGGPYTITWTVNDDWGVAGSCTQTCTLTVVKAHEFRILNRGPMADGFAGEPYGDRLVVSGDDGAGATWSIAAGALPPGVAIEPATGRINGTIGPAALGSYEFTVRAALASGASAEFEGEITVHPAPLPGTLHRVAGHGVIADNTGYEDNVAATLDFIGERPWGLGFDPAGNIVVTDTVGSSRVRKIDRVTRLVTTMAGTRYVRHGLDGGLARDTSVRSPAGVAWDAAGNCYFGSGFGGEYVRRILPDGTIRSVGSFSSGILPSPCAIVVDSNSRYLYAVDVGSCIFRYELNSGTSVPVIIAGTPGLNGVGNSGDGGRAGDARLAYPWGLGMDADGALYVAQSSLMYADAAGDALVHSSIRKIAPDPAAGGTITVESIITTVNGTRGTCPQSDIVFDTSGTMYYISHDLAGSQLTSAVVALDSNGNTTTIGPPLDVANVSYEKLGLALDPSSDDLYVAFYCGVYKVVR